MEETWPAAINAAGPVSQPTDDRSIHHLRATCSTDHHARKKIHLDPICHLCDLDRAGRARACVQAWVEEMAPYVKSVDGGHLVTAGLEGFYGAGAHESKELNPWRIYYGTNFVETHRARGVDFATIHLYPDAWLWGCAADAQRAFLRNWTRAHARDAALYLRKSLLVTEYDKFLWDTPNDSRTLPPLVP